MTTSDHSRTVRVLAVGDRFVPAATLANALRVRLDGTGVLPDIREMQLHYPTVDALTLATENRVIPRAIWEEPADIDARAEADRADTVVREYTGPVDGLVGELADVDVLLVHAAPVSQAAIASAPRLSVVGCVRGGPVNVNRVALNDRRIPLFSVTGRNAEAVAEYMIGSILTLSRGLATASAAVRAGRWSLVPWTAEGSGFELKGRTIGLVGYGQVGRALTPIAHGFGMRVITHDPFQDEAAIEAATGNPPHSLDDLLDAADVVVLTARLTPENHHMIAAAQFARMKPGALIVNCARAELVDYDALLAALDDGDLGGAVLDVFEPEPPLATDPLLHHPRIMPTPHMAGATTDTVELGARLLADSVAQFLLEGRVDHAHNASQL